MNKKLLMLASLMSLIFMNLTYSTSTPNASRVYADRFTPEVAQSQVAGVQGFLDESFGTNGSLDLSSQLAASQAKSVKILFDGSMLVLLDDGVDSKVVKYRATGDVLSSGFGVNGICSLPELTSAQNMMVDSDGRILVMGASDVGGNPWIRRLTPAGVLDSSFALIDGEGWSFVGAIAEQSSGRLIVVGQSIATGYGRIVAYTAAGLIDTTFGMSGVVLFDGLSGRPVSPSGLYSVSINADDSIFVGFKNGRACLAKFTANGALDTAFNPSGTVPGVLTDALGTSTVTASQIRVALNDQGNICIAGQVGNNILVRLYNGTTAASVFSLLTITDGSDNLNISDVIALVDGSFLVIGYNSDDFKMRVTKVTSSGALDENFNPDPNKGAGVFGAHEFAIGSGITESVLLSGAVAPDGRIYVAGYEVDGYTTKPYLSRLFNELYVASVAQYPSTVIQGDLDLDFGTNSSDTYRGINYLFNGNYGTKLEQQANVVIELASSKLLVGMTGMLNDSDSSNMMLTRLSSTGVLDTTFNSTGKLALQRVYNDEYLTSLLEDQDGNIYVAGYSPSGENHAILRKYDSAGTLLWSASDSFLDGSDKKSLKVGIQSSQRVLLFMQNSGSYGEFSEGSTGSIAAFNPLTGALDITFNATGDVQGVVSSQDVGLSAMGPIYASAIGLQDNILVAYQNNYTGNVDVAYIIASGSHLISEFGTDGIISGIFSNINQEQIRLVLDNDDRFVVAVADGDSYLVKRFYIDNGAVDTTFGTEGFMSIELNDTAVINKLTALDNNKIIITGVDESTDDSMIITRITSEGALDTEFNPQGVTPGVLPIKVGNIVANYYSRDATDLLVQAASGNMIIIGNEQQTSSDSTPMIARVFGESGTLEVKQSPVTEIGAPGTIDITFGTTDNGSQDLTSLIDAGSAKFVLSYKNISDYQGKLLVGVDTADTMVKIARINEYNMSLDTSFGTNGITTLSTLSTFFGLSGLKHISLDAQDNILVAGTFNGSGWVKRLTPDGLVDVDFQGFANLVEVSTVYQQKSGRYIVAGRDSNGRGVLVAFQDHIVSPHLTLQVDTTFNPLGTIPGWYTIGTTGLYNLVINSDDSLLVAYSDTTVKVAKLAENGAALVSSFGTAGIKNTGMNPKNASEIRVAIDSNEKVIVASSIVTGGTSVSVVRYTRDGGIDTSFNETGAVNNITGLGSVGVILADIIVTNESISDDKIILLGSNTSGGNGKMFIARLGTDGLLDPIFNEDPTSPDVSGIITFSIDSSVSMYHGALYIDGKIYAAGAGTGNKPLLMAVFGDNYIQEAVQQPLESLPGIFDQTLPTSGILDLDSYLPSIDLAGFNGRLMHIYDDGSMLLAFTDRDTAAKVVKLKADRTLDTSFNSAVTPGYTTLNEPETLRDMIVASGANDDGAIYLCGGSDDLWVRKISANGVDLGLIIHEDNSKASSIAKSTNGRLLISTVNGNGESVIVAYKQDSSERDLSFGNNGQGEYVIGVSNWWLDTLTIDSEDRMYCAYPSNYSYVNNGDIVVDRVKVNGTGIDPWPSFGTPIHISDEAEYVFTYLDETNNRLVVAAQDGSDDGNVILIRRYNATTGADDGGLVTVRVTGEDIKIQDLFLDEDQYIYVLATNSSQDRPVLARITPSMELDVSYGALEDIPGIVNMDLNRLVTDVAAAGIHPDRRVYILGYQENTGDPQMIRLFGDRYTAEQSDITFKAIPGTQDLTLDPNAVTPNAGIVLSSLSGATQLVGATPRAICTLENGSSYVAFSHANNIDVAVVKFNADFELATDFGFENTGITSWYTMTTCNSMNVDSQGRILVVGDNEGVQTSFRFSADGTSKISLVSDVAMVVGTQIAEQKSSRILVSGKTDTSGIILAYQNTGLATDTTFGPATLDGFYLTGVNTQIDDFCVDTNDDIYIVYRDENSYVVIKKINADGSGPDATFVGGSTGVVGTAPACVAINTDGNILVGMTTSAGLKTVLYNGTTGNSSPEPVTVYSTGSPVMTRLVGVGTKFVASAYTVTPTMLTILVTSAGVLDVTFNPDGTVPGVASSNAESAIAMYDIAVHPDGKFTMVGVNNTEPVLMRVYGNPYVGQVSQFPGTSPAGTLDATLYPTAGQLNLNTLLSSESVNLSGYVPRKVYTYSNNNVLLAFDNGANTILVRVFKDFTLDTSFNEVGAVMISGKTGITGLYVDENDNIFVAGGATISWVRAFNDNGTSLTGFTSPTSNLSNGAYGFGLQKLNRILVAGQNSNGVVYGYTSTTGKLDTTFGNGISGIFTTNVARPVADISIDNLDRIAFVYADATGKSVLGRIYSNGSDFDDLDSPTQINNVTGNQLKVVHDISSNIIVAAATTTGFTLRRYNTNGVDSPGNSVDIAAGTAGTSVLTSLYTTSDGKTVLVGYESVSHAMIVARLTSDFELDTTFNADGNIPGLLSTTTGAMTIAAFGTIYNDNRVVVVGANSDNDTAYMSRVFGDDYVTMVGQPDLLGVFGTLDMTYATGGALSLVSDLGASIPYSILTTLNGSVYYGVEVVADGTSRIMKLDGLGAAVDAFGTDGILDLTEGGYDNLRNMQFDHNGHILVTGGIAGAPWALRLDATTGNIINSFDLSNLYIQFSVAILEQTNDRVLVLVSDGDQGGVVGFVPDGSDRDVTFGNLVPGLFADNNYIDAIINSFAVDNNDRIFVGYTTLVGYTESRRATLGCIRANGTAIDADIDDYNGFAETGFIVDAFGVEISGNVYVGVDSNNYPIIAAVSGSDILVNKYDYLGNVLEQASISTIASPVLTGIVVSDTDEIMLIGNTVNGVFTLQLGSDLVLDTTFGDDGISVFTVSDIVTVSSAALTVNGTMYLGGDNITNGPLLLRIYSDRFIGENDQQPSSATPGTFDVALNGTGGVNLTDRSNIVDVTGYAGKAMYAYSDSGKLLMALDNGASTKLVRTDSDGFIDVSFGSAGFASYNSPTGVSAIEIAVDGHILLVGTNWVTHYSQDGSEIENFETPSNFSQGSDIGIQVSGRYIICGYDTLASQGSLVAYYNNGELDRSFGLVTQEQPNNERYLSGVDAPIHSFVINNDDTIVVAYNDNNNVTLRKLNATASVVDSNFGTNGTLVAIEGTSVTGDVLLIKDSNQNLIVAARTNTNELSVIRYNANGSSSDKSQTISTLTAPVLTGLQETSDHQILLSGYDVSGNAFVVRMLDYYYDLDGTFGTSGVFTGTLEGVQEVYAMTNRVDGRIALLGSDSNSDPILLSVNGDPYVGQNTDARQYPASTGVAGTLDYTLDSSGALNLDAALSTELLDLSGSYARKSHVYDDGTMLIAFNKGITTIVVRLHKDQTLDLSFGQGTGFVTIPSAQYVHDMFVDDAQGSDGSIYLTGTYSGEIWTRKLTAQGIDLEYSAPNLLNMTNATRIRKSTNGRILIAGLATVGTISAYNSDVSGLDLSFGNGLGAYQTTLSTPIVDMVIDEFDRLYIAYNDISDGTIKIQRLQSNGSGVDTSFGTVSISEMIDFSSAQIRCALDQTNDQLVVAFVDGISASNVIRVYRYSIIDGSSTGTLNTISISGKVLRLTDLFIDAGQDTYVIGYNETDSNVLVARIDGASSSTSISLDTQYGNGGIANLDAGTNLTIVQSGIIHLDGRIYVLGYNGTPTPAMARIFDEDYDLELNQAQEPGAVGAPDVTLNPTELNDSDKNGILLSSQNSFGSDLNGYTGKAIFANADGSSYIAFSNDTYVVVGKLDCDQNPVTSGFGTNGLTTPVIMSIVNTLAVDAQGRILVAGTHGGSSVVLRYPTTGGSPTVFEGYPSLVVGNTVLEQKSGRILLSGRKVTDGNYGVIFAYQNTGAAEDITFGPHGSDGFYAINVNQPVDDMVVDENDDIYLVYRDTTLKLQKVKENGAGRDSVFNEGSTIDTGILATEAGRIAINNDGNILVAATTDAQHVATALYNGTDGTAIGSVESIFISNFPILTDMTAAGSNFVASVYTTAPVMKILRVLGSDGTLDQDFGDEGIATSYAQSAHAMYGIAVQPDGRILMVGNQEDNEIYAPVLLRHYGSPYVSQDAQFPGAADAGILDTTLNPTSGALDLNGLLQDIDLQGFAAKCMYTYSNGSLLIAFDNGTDAKLIRVYKDMTLDASFNEVGYLEIAELTPVMDLYVDEDNTIYVAGCRSTFESKLYVLDNYGVEIFSPLSFNLLYGAYAVGKQSLGRTILAGQSSISGALAGYTTSGELDPEFGMAGVVSTTLTAPITDISIDALDRIVYVSVIDGSSVLVRLDAAGSTVDTTLGSPTPINNINGYEVQVVHDAAGNIIVAAATTSGYKLRRYNPVDGSSSLLVTFNASGVSHLGNLYTTSDGKTTLVGFTESGNIVVARLTSDFALDETFNANGSPAGVLITTIGSMSTAVDGIVYADDRILLVGSGGYLNGQVPYMARIFGDDYVTPISQSPAVGVPGSMDLTLGYQDGRVDGAFELDTLSGISSGVVAQAILAQEDGSMVIALSNGSEETLLMTLDDDLSIKNPGIITIEEDSPQGVSGLTKDALGRVLVAGSSGSDSWIHRYNIATGSAVGSFETVSGVTSTVGVLNQAVGRVILGGDQSSSLGILAGFAPLSYVSGNSTDAAILDPSFGIDGLFTDNRIKAVDNFYIDTLDRIVVGFVDGSTIKLGRVRPNGSGLDTGFGTNGIVSTPFDDAVGSKPVRLAVDNNGQIVVACPIENGGIGIMRYNDAGTTRDISINMTTASTGFTNPVVSQVITTLTNQIIILGYDDILDGKMFVMRLTSQGALDQTFNPDGYYVPGIFVYDIDGANNIHRLLAGDIAGDGRIVTVGYEYNSQP